MSAKKPTPDQMKSTVWTMLELDLIQCAEMKDLAQWMLEEYRTSIAKQVVANMAREKKAEGKKFQSTAAVVKIVRKYADITFDQGGLIDSCALSVGLILNGADAE
jgi:hypothetical protein